MTRQKKLNIESALVLTGLIFLTGLKQFDLIQENELKQHKPLIEKVQTQRTNYLEARHTALSKESEQREKFNRAYSEHLNDVYGED